MATWKLKVYSNDFRRCPQAVEDVGFSIFHDPRTAGSFESIFSPLIGVVRIPVFCWRNGAGTSTIQAMTRTSRSLAWLTDTTLWQVKATAHTLGDLDGLSLAVSPQRAALADKRHGARNRALPNGNP
jgi:hypothetical protein